ncbi:MAG: type II toxin-antitoxin system VapC family toxin [Gaiellales bacterium]
MTRRAYFDSSALVKLVVREPESRALRAFVRRRTGRSSCALARVEVVRAVRRHGPTAIGRARQLVDRFELVRIDDALLDNAALLPVEDLRSLDAIHLAAAQRLGRDLAVLVSYDERMLSAARAVGIPVTTPR